MSKKRPHYIYHNTKLDLYLLFKTYKELESTTGIPSATIRNHLAPYRQDKERYQVDENVTIVRVYFEEDKNKLKEGK